MVGLIARAGLGFGVFLTAIATLLLLNLPAGSAEFTVTTLTVGLGVFLMLISVFALYIERKRR